MVLHRESVDQFLHFVPFLRIRVTTYFAGAMLGALLAHGRFAGAQTALTRTEAQRLAATLAPRTALGRTDTLAAAAQLMLARQFENPSLSAAYSKSEPQTHFTLDIPFELPGSRAPRIAGAQSALSVARLRQQYGQSALALDIDTAYTRAQLSLARATLSARTARDADSLLAIATVRRDAGDASDLDVELARVFAGQSVNVAIGDSLAAQDDLVLLQTLIGLRADSATITLSERIDISLDGASVSPNRSLAPVDANIATSSTLNTESAPVVIAETEAEVARHRVLAEQRRRFASPSLSLGFESVGPTSGGILPTVGIALPLPLFNSNVASIQAAKAEEARTRAMVTLARLEQSAALLMAQRSVTASTTRLARSAQLVASANRIAALSVVAYREGAATLASVLEAQRSARELLTQYADDVAAARIAESVLRFVSLPGGVPQ